MTLRGQSVKGGQKAGGKPLDGRLWRNARTYYARPKGYVMEIWSLP